MIVHKCDFCGCEIPTVKKKIFGIEKEVLNKGKIHCEQWECDKLFESIELCKSCAEIFSAKLDYKLLKMKSQCTER